MKAVVVRVNGGAESSRVEEVVVPEPGAGEVRVSVRSAGLNYLDIYQRNGAVAAPFRAGVEGVGQIDAVGVGVDVARIGDRVGWLSGQGSFAESLVLDEAKTVAIPDDITDDQAVALLMQGLTANYLTTSAVEIDATSTVLIHAAAGGVGRLLVQICRHLGATVIATASTEDKRRIARDSGAHHTVPYEGFSAAVLELTHGSGVDVIYDGVGQSTVGDDFDALAVRGTLVVIGAASGPPPPVEFARLASKSLSVIRPSIAHFTAERDELKTRAEQVFGWARAGIVTTTIARRYDLQDIERAENELESRSLAGKLVIDIS